jgi:hypothetical protein
MFARSPPAGTRLNLLRAFLLHLLMPPAFALGKFEWANHIAYEFGDHDH